MLGKIKRNIKQTLFSKIVLWCIRKVFANTKNIHFEEVFRPPKRGQPGHRTVRIIGVPGSRTWGVGGRRISAPPYHPYLWVIWVMNLNPSSQKKKTQSQTAPKPTQSPPHPFPPPTLSPPTLLPVSTDDIWADHHPTSRMSTRSWSRGPTAHYKYIL